MKHRHFILIFLLIISISFTSLLLLHKKDRKSIAEIYSNDTLIHTVDLREVTSAYELPVTYMGRTNIVLIENGKISVKSADCPDNLCVKQGYLSAYPIVCAPNKLYIKFSNYSDNIDAISR